MSRVEFIEILNFELGAIKKIEREKFITYYEEIIDDYMENGFEEEEVIDKIGNPKIIAKNILSEQDTVNIKVPLTNSKVINMILLIIGFPLWGSLLFAGLGKEFRFFTKELSSRLLKLFNRKVVQL